MRIKYKVLIGVFTSTIAVLGCAPKSMNLETPHDPCLKPSGGTSFIVCDRFNYKINNQSYFVPKGFITDLATIPNSAWVMSAIFKNKYIPAAVIHDYLYSCKSRFSRIEIDSIFYSGLLEEGVEPKRAKALYYFLLVTGWHYYTGDKQCVIGTEHE